MVYYCQNFFLFWRIYGIFQSIGSGSLFSIILLCKIIDIAWCIAMVLISLKVCSMIFSSILNFFSMIFIEGMCVVAIALVVMTINGSMFHPLLLILFISD